MSERTDSRMVETPTFRILVAANRLARPFPERIGAAHDLTLAEWRCMMVLAARPGASGEEVAQTLGVDRMGVSRALRSLRKTGRANVRDAPGRRNAWVLSDEGWRLFDRIAPLALERDAALLEGMSEGERAAVTTALDRTEGLD